MSQKVKMLILVVIILLATLVVGVYFIKKNKVLIPAPQITVDTINQPIDSAQQAQQQVSPTGETAANSDIVQKVGTISMVDPAFIIIEEVNGSSQFAITKDTQFFKREGLAKTKIVATDVKVLMNVSLTVNSKTGEIIEVEVI